MMEIKVGRNNHTALRPGTGRAVQEECGRLVDHFIRTTWRYRQHQCTEVPAAVFRRHKSTSHIREQTKDIPIARASISMAASNLVTITTTAVTTGARERLAATARKRLQTLVLQVSVVIDMLK